MESVVREFRSDFGVLARLLARLAIAGTVLLVLAAAAGQWRAGRFPSYRDLGLSIIIAPLMCAAIGVLFYAAVLAFPVKLLSDGVRTYDAFGRYRSIRWCEVTGVEFMSVYGLDYLMIHASTVSQPLTIPIGLAEMTEFRRLVRAQTGPDHIVAQALDAAVT